MIQETVEDNNTRTEFVDENGKLTYAIDKHYAVVVKTRNDDKKVVLEQYFDENGKPAKQSGGYYGIAYDYNRDGLAGTITYLNAEGQPSATNSGYTVIQRTYNSAGQSEDDFYYDARMERIACTGKYYGLHREYDTQGNNCAMSYLGKDGQLILNSQGYARVVYYREQNGIIQAEMYLDCDGKPVKQQMGQFGVSYLRDEDNRITDVNYLDENGDPLTISAGYASKKQTYYRDGSLDTEMYYDQSGNQVALAKGQYGVKHIGDVLLFLNRKGNVRLCVDNMLNGAPFLVVFIGCLFCLIIVLSPRKLQGLLTLAYIVFILYETLMFRETGDSRMNLELFSCYKKFMEGATVRFGAINNIWLFLPFGAGLYCMQRRKKAALLMTFLFSVTIETVQYITGFGMAEFDDVFNNTLGGVIGFLMAYEITVLRRRVKQLPE